MQRIKNSWELGKISWSVLKADRSLAWFPVLSFVFSLLVFGVFGGLVALTGIDDQGAKDSLKPIGYVFLVAAYLGLALVSTYFLGALVHAANERLNGRSGSVRDSLGAANGKIHRILPWAALQATVSVILQAIQDRGWLGMIVARLLGTAWAILTFLALPVIMLEDASPGAALRRSGQLIKGTWGENVVGQAGFGLLGLVAALPAIFVIGIASAIDQPVTWVLLGATAAVWIVIVSIAIAAMAGIYRTALYRYAVDGEAPKPFAGIDLGGAFKLRQQRGRFFN